MAPAKWRRSCRHRPTALRAMELRRLRVRTTHTRRSVACILLVRTVVGMDPRDGRPGVGSLKQTAGSTRSRLWSGSCGPAGSTKQILRSACKSSGRRRRSPGTRRGPRFRNRVARGSIGGYTVGMSKVMVSMADDLLAEIDAEAKRRATSRSALLATAARRELDRRDPVQVAEAIARSEQRFREAGSFDAAELVRGDRDTRR
jgi:hypothetical protein